MAPKSSRKRASSVLIAVEITMATVLLSGSIGLLATFWQTVRPNPGFNPEGLQAFRIVLPGNEYRDGRSISEFYRALLRRVDQINTVGSSAVVSTAPISGGRLARGFMRHGDPLPDLDHTQFAIFYTASPGYFNTLGTAVTAGREFTEQDLSGSVPVTVINETVARLLWPRENPIGRYLRLHTDEDFPWLVVGVAADTRTRMSTGDVMPQVFVPQAQVPTLAMNVVLRTKSDIQLGRDEIQAFVSELDSAIPVFQFQSSNSILRDSLSSQRSLVGLISLSAGIAILLAAVGVFGVVSAGVSGRVREIGIRMALGAGGRSVVLLAMRQGLIPVAIGFVLAFLLMYWFSSVSESGALGFEMQPWTMIPAVVCMALVATMACYLPARKAARLDPVEALRND